MSEFKIKKVSKPDVPRALHKAIFAEEADWEEPRNSQYWVIYDDMSDPVGFACCYQIVGEPTAMFLSRAGLLPCARGKGLHRRLIEVRLRWGKRQGLDQAITYTHRRNATSFANLQQCGFALYIPENEYAGEDFLYFYTELV